MNTNNNPRIQDYGIKKGRTLCFDLNGYMQSLLGQGKPCRKGSSALPGMTLLSKKAVSSRTLRRR